MHHCAHTRIACLVLSLVGVACQVGAPLVDRRGENEGVGPIGCLGPPRCEELPELELELETKAASPVQVAACGGSDPCGTPSVDAAIGCEGTPELPSQLSCTGISLTPPTSDEARRAIMLEGATWSNVNVTLVNPLATPLHITLHGAQLQSVFVRLVGAVELEISEPLALDDLRVAGRSFRVANETRAPELHLDKSDATHLSIGEHGQPFPGRVSLHNTKVNDAVILADNLVWESVFVQRAEIQARDLSFIDLDLETTKLTTESGILTAFRVRETWISSCGEMRAIDGSLTLTVFESCPGERAVFYDVFFTSGQLEGAFELDASSVTGARVGLHSATDLLSYQTSFGSVVFCDQLAQLALGHFSTVRCSGCDETFNAGEHVCSLPVGEEPYRENFCESFTTDTVPPACPPGLPGRSRPRSGPL